MSVVLVGVFGSPSFVALVCFVGVAWFLFGWVCLVFLAVGGFWLFSLLSRLAFVGFALRQSGLGHSYILFSPAPLRP